MLKMKYAAVYIPLFSIMSIRTFFRPSNWVGGIAGALVLAALTIEFLLFACGLDDSGTCSFVSPLSTWVSFFTWPSRVFVEMNGGNSAPAFFRYFGGVFVVAWTYIVVCLGRSACIFVRDFYKAPSKIAFLRSLHADFSLSQEDQTILRISLLCLLILWGGYT